MSSNIHKKRLKNARRRRYERQKPNMGSYVETLITQCIVCAIILSAVLIIRIIDVPATNAIREQFHYTITHNADMQNDAINFGAMFINALNRADQPEQLAYENEPVHASPASTSDSDFRIDENVLQSIRGDEPPAFR